MSGDEEAGLKKQILSSWNPLFFSYLETSDKESGSGKIPGRHPRASHGNVAVSVSERLPGHRFRRLHGRFVFQRRRNDHHLSDFRSEGRET